jgi:AcrR family transcriptional regulator
MCASIPKPPRPGGEALWASRQEEILEVAIRLFAEHGYSNTDTQLLAEELGVGKGTIYRYFPSKRDLFLAAVDCVMRKMLELVLSRIDPIEDPLQRIFTGIRTFLRFFGEHPEYVELLIQERAQFKDRKKPTFQEHREVNVERWRDLYRGLIAAGRIRDIPVERITDVVSDLLYGTIFTNYFAGQQKAIDVQAQNIIDVLFRGLLTTDERCRYEHGLCAIEPVGGEPSPLGRESGTSE